MKFKSIGLSSLILIAFASNSVYATENAMVETFTPQGIVKDVRQVAVRFSETMVPFGNPRETIQPFMIVCPEKGTGRWGDGKNWIFDFDHDLPAGAYRRWIGRS